MSEHEGAPPRDNLFRAAMPSVNTRSVGDVVMPTLYGHFARFNEWTEIDSVFEGRFLERFQPGAFKKTIREARDQVRALFQHGRDPQIGDKPLGPIDELREDGDVGAYYEVPLLDTSYNRELIPGLEAGLYGASFRFSIVREDFDDDPDAGPHNPRGLPERTVKEARLFEFGPVTFPAYAGATAGVRSITDLVRDVDAMQLATPILLDEERLGRARAFITRAVPIAATAIIPEEPPASEPDESTTALPVDRAEESPHPVRGRRETSPRLKVWGQDAPYWRID